MTFVPSPAANVAEVQSTFVQDIIKPFLIISVGSGNGANTAAVLASLRGILGSTHHRMETSLLVSFATDSQGE